MKKQNIISAALFGFALCLSGIVSAQSTHQFEKGTVTFSAGVGVGNQYEGNYYNSPFGTKAVIEVGLWKAGPGTISLGGEVGASFSNGGSIYSNYKTRTIVVAGRSAWHYGWKVKGLDTYAGLAAGAGFHNIKYNKNGTVNESNVSPVFAGFIGASYFVTPVFGFNVEVGNDINVIQAGIVLKLK